MRILWAAAVAALVTLSLQDAAPPRVVVVIDADAPAADPVAAARLRDGVLRAVDGRVPVAAYELNADRLTAIADADAARFRHTRFTQTPPTYSGIAVTFAESVEVLRGNEFVRDSVIDRECPTPPRECAGRVHAAVLAEVRRAEASGAGKLRRLAAAAEGWRGSRVVLFTAGWPTRDDARVGLGAAVRELRRGGVWLVVVHVPPQAPYRGLVRDASESLAAQLPATFVPLADDVDVTPAAEVAWARLPLTGAPVVAETAAPSQPPLATTAPGLAATAAARPGGSVAEPVEPDAGGDVTPVPVAPGAGEPDPAAAVADPVLRRASAYVERFEGTFTSVLWHERYEQEERAWRRFGSSGATTSAVSGRRMLESELFFAWLPQDRTWITVRDAVAVDGRPRPAGERRLPSLAARATVSLPELRELALQNGRFNLGRIVRTFNEPTLALLFLDERHRAGVRFTRTTRQPVEGRMRVTYQFVEERRPTVIRSGARDMPVRGTFAIDEVSGAVWTTTIEMSEPVGGLTGRMAVDYQPHVAFDVLVPREMRESYASPTQEITALATYSDFRRFQTSGRLILTP